MDRWAVVYGTPFDATGATVPGSAANLTKRFNGAHDMYLWPFRGRVPLLLPLPLLLYVY